jgi:hypothetical protein
VNTPGEHQFPCMCEALAGLTVCSDDPQDENRIRRTDTGAIEIQRWRLVSTITIPDSSSTPPPLPDQVSMTGVIPVSAIDDDRTLDDIEVPHPDEEHPHVYVS